MIYKEIVIIQRVGAIGTFTCDFNKKYVIRKSRKW